LDPAELTLKALLTCQLVKGSSRGVGVDLADVEAGVCVGRLLDGQHKDVAT